MSIPVVARDGKLFENRNSFYIYYSDSLVLYNFPIRYDSASDGILVSSGYKNYFFVYQKQSTIGYIFNKDSTRENNQRVRVDSMLNVKGLQNFQWHILLDRQPIFSREESDRVLREIYVGPNQYDKAKIDTIILNYSDRFKDYDFSFSKTLDSVKGKKLFKIQLIYPDAYSPEYKITFPKRETYFEMRDNRIENPAEIQEVFDWYGRLKKQD